MEIGSRDPATATYGSHYGPYAGRMHPLYLCAKFESDSSIHSIVKTGSQNLKIGSCDPRPLRGSFMVHAQGGSVLYLRTKFEADSLIHSKVNCWICISIYACSLPNFMLLAWSVAELWMKAMLMCHFNGKIGNAHAPCHVTGGCWGWLDSW